MMNISNEMKTNDKNYEIANTIYNSDFKQPKQLKKVSNIILMRTKSLLITPVGQERLIGVPTSTVNMNSVSTYILKQIL